MRQPPFLKKNDKIAIISPARKISNNEIKFAIEILESWGLQVIKGKHLHCEYNQFAGDDLQRASDLINSFLDDSIKAIFCARGGYGTIRTLFTAIKENKNFLTNKWLIGYSDITVLHSFLNKNKIMSIHATMPVNFEYNDKDSIDLLKKIIFGKLPIKYEFEGCKLNVSGEVKAPIIGGNLSVLYSLRGTSFEPDYKNKILFLEDLDEYLYHIDRMMMNLKIGGLLNEVAGILVGDMIDMNDNEVPFGKKAKEIIYEHIKYLGVPVGFIKGIGHSKRNLPLIFEKEVKMTVTKEKTILIF